MNYEDDKAFLQWMDTNNYSFYDGADRCIHLATRKLIATETLYRQFGSDNKSSENRTSTALAFMNQ